MTAKQYIREITERSCLPGAQRKRVKKDLENEINSAIERGQSMEQIIKRMGEPDEVAAGLYENYVDVPKRPFREYKSKRTLFGLPLVHIISGSGQASVPRVRIGGVRAVNIGGRYDGNYFNVPTARGVFAVGPKAKGIVAVGNLSTGVISIGNLSAGIVSIGNLSAGLFTLGNLAIAGLLALGNAAIGPLSAGNAAIGYGAAGNFASGRYAIGNETAGVFTYSISDLAAQFEQIKAFIASLDAPAAVRAFFGVVQNALETLIDPTPAVPMIVASSIVFAAIITALAVIPYWLLKKSN